jgi:uncharacterized protein
MNPTVLILPGYGDSGPGHWQTRWEETHEGFVRVQQRDWNRPACTEWVNTLEESVSRASPDIVLVAHSLGCLLVPHWTAQTARRIKGALLVAPPDPDGPSYPEQAVGFEHPPLTPLPFASIVVASTDDPYAGLDFARTCARAWDSRFVDIGPRGHINGDSGLHDWPEGYALLRQLFD